MKFDLKHLKSANLAFDINMSLHDINNKYTFKDKNNQLEYDILKAPNQTDKYKVTAYYKHHEVMIAYYLKDNHKTKLLQQNFFSKFYSDLTFNLRLVIDYSVDKIMHSNLLNGNQKKANQYLNMLLTQKKLKVTELNNDIKLIKKYLNKDTDIHKD